MEKKERIKKALGQLKEIMIKKKVVIADDSSTKGYELIEKK